MLIASHEFIPDWQPVQWASLWVLGAVTLFCAVGGLVLLRKARRLSSSAGWSVGLATVVVTALLVYIGFRASGPLATVIFTDRELLIARFGGTTRIPLSSTSQAKLTHEFVVFESSGNMVKLPRYAVWRLGNLPVDGRYLFNEFEGRSRRSFTR